jgi:nicotinate phosphoribosyltransferase
MENTMAEHENLSLLTDLYQLTMAQAYFREQQTGRATFSLFVRTYPSNRGYFVAAGLQDALDYLESLHFDKEALDYLDSLGLFSDDFIHYLSGLRFTGDVYAIQEGQVFFAHEPVLEVTAPVIEAQIVETFLINQIHLQTLIATKAARCVDAAGKRQVVDFALRRTHGSDAGMKVARASYCAGFAGTSNVMAGRRYGIPVMGTMAHSFVSSFANELDAFRAYAASFPDRTILLIDTYDTIAGANNAVQIGRELSSHGYRLVGVRIDSGELAELAFEVRRILDAADLTDVKIIGSGGLDEFDLMRLAKAPFDSYGVGTKMGVSADAPTADFAYKLVEYQDRPVLKLSPGKASWPGKKQVFRALSAAGTQKDVIGLREEDLPGDRLLEEVMRQGVTVRAHPSLFEIRARVAAELNRLPESLRKIREPDRPLVEFSPKLKILREAIGRKSG